MSLKIVRKAIAHLKKKFNLPFLLLSDFDGKICQSYGAWGTKTNYGKAYEGLIRSTFVIDSKGIIQQAWYNVKAKGHVEKVLKTLWKNTGNDLD